MVEDPHTVAESVTDDERSVLQKQKIAVFHDNFAQMGGAERTAEAIHQALPGSRLYTTLSVPERLSHYLRSVPLHATWMDRLPAKARLFRAYFLLYPFAIDRVDLSSYDLIVTSCFGYAKGVRRSATALHVCYCHTPMRWIWRSEDYLSREKNRVLKQALLSLPLRWLKRWEMRAARRPDLYIANSHVVAERLRSTFGIEAKVIPPPIETARFAPPLTSSPVAPDDFYLVLSRLVPYKRFDLAVKACTASNRRLVVIGGGPDRKRLESFAGPTVTFLGRASDEVVQHHAQHCKALLFPGEEDFGMTPLEINAAGRPVVAFAAGGATETVVEGLNGTFFHEPTPESMIEAMDRLEATTWNPAAIQAHAKFYDVALFKQRIRDFMEEALRNRP